LIYTATFSSSF